MRHRAALFVGVILAAGCASVPAPGPAAGDCRDAEYRGRFEPAGPGGTPSRFRVSIRACGTTEALLEFRGLVGGAALVAGVRVGERVRLVFPSRRIVAEGPDRSGFWRHWTGIAVDGGVVRSLLAGGAVAAAGDWSIDVEPPENGGRFPEAVRARSGPGDRLDLAKLHERPAAGPLVVPDPQGPDWRRSVDEWGDRREDPSE